MCPSFSGQIQVLQAFEELASLSPARLPSINNSNAAFPSNISGTFKGSWSLSQPNTSSHVLPVLDQGQGTVAFQLTAVSSGQDEVLDVQVILEKAKIDGHVALFGFIVWFLQSLCPGTHGGG